MEKIASCSCGDSTVIVNGKPSMVATCSCDDCKKRTGSAFGISAYFKANKIQALPHLKTYTQIGSSKNKVVRHFCENCGTTLFWQAEILPDLIGIAAGCFDKQDIPEPTAAVWNCSKLDWIEFPNNWIKLEKQS